MNETYVENDVISSFGKRMYVLSCILIGVALAIVTLPIFEFMSLIFFELPFASFAIIFYRSFWGIRPKIVLYFWFVVAIWPVVLLAEELLRGADVGFGILMVFVTPFLWIVYLLLYRLVSLFKKKSLINAQKNYLSLIISVVVLVVAVGYSLWR